MADYWRLAKYEVHVGKKLSMPWTLSTEHRMKFTDQVLSLSNFITGATKISRNAFPGYSRHQWKIRYNKCGLMGHLNITMHLCGISKRIYPSLTILFCLETRFNQIHIQLEHHILQLSFSKEMGARGHSVESLTDTFNGIVCVMSM